MGAKLILADDSVTIQKVVELTLADEAYDITMVSDGASALQKAEEIQAELILADIVMPELNGYELCEKIRAHPTLSNTPILLLSSTFETYDEERGQRVGANDHIIKPFESDELVQKIRTYLEAKKEQSIPAEPPSMGEETILEDLAPSAVSLSTGPEIVEEEAFDFELSDDFMEEAEEMFEETEDVSVTELSVPDETEEFLPEESFDELPELAFPSPADGAAGDSFVDLTTQEVAEEAPPVFSEELPELEETEMTTASTTDIPSEAPALSTMEVEPSSELNSEIDKEILHEKEVDVYEIPEEFTEGPDPFPSLPDTSESPFAIKAEPSEDLIDDFMEADVAAYDTDHAADADHELTENEVLTAMESGTESSQDETAPKVEPPSAEEDRFDHVFPVQGAATSEWSPELSAYGGTPEAISDDVIEKPLDNEIVGGEGSAIDEKAVRKIISEMVEKMAGEIIERVAWEVIPDLAEVLIQKEIQKLQQKVEHS